MDSNPKRDLRERDFCQRKILNAPFPVLPEKGD